MQKQRGGQRAEGGREKVVKGAVEMREQEDESRRKIKRKSAEE